MNKLFRRILDLLYPPKCVFCGKILRKDEENVCLSCRTKLPVCTDKLQAGPYLDEAAAVFSYEGLVRDSLLRYKFGGREQYAVCYGEWLAAAVSARLPSVDAVTWVPVSRKRKRKRGYDQAMLLARETARRLGKPLVPTLRKTRDNPAQSGIHDASERRVNVLGAYECIADRAVLEKRLLLVDDIFTTGATLGEAARTLRVSGAALVCGAVLAVRK